MKKYKCECKYNKCEVSMKMGCIAFYCFAFSGITPEWEEVKETEVKEEEKAEVILNLPSWCKVGEVVYYTKGKLYCQIHEVDKKRGIILFNSEYLITDFVSISELTEARLRPFNESELRELVGKKIANKTTKTRYLIVTSNSTSVSAAGYIYNKEELLNGFIFTDGSPCGVYEHLENGEWVE